MRCSAPAWAMVAALMGCDGNPPVPPVIVPDPPAPTTAPAPGHDCPVVVAHYRHHWEAEADGATAEAAQTAACDQVCAKLARERGTNCRDETRYELQPFSVHSSVGSGPAETAHGYQCRVIERERQTHRGSSPVSKVEACRAAYRASCPDGGRCWAQVVSVDGLAVARLTAVVGAGRPGAAGHTGSEASPAGGTSCTLGLRFRGPEQVGEASDDTSGSLDNTKLKRQARAAACRKLGLDEQPCADADRVREVGTSHQLQIIAGKSSATLKVTLAIEEAMTATGRGKDKESACVAAVREACRQPACRDASRVVVEALEGVQLAASPPPRPPGVFGF